MRNPLKVELQKFRIAFLSGMEYYYCKLIHAEIKCGWWQTISQIHFCNHFWRRNKSFSSEKTFSTQACL